MQARLMYIDADGHLYRGYGREWPLIVWEVEKCCWASCKIVGPKEWGSGEFVTAREAERCYPGSTTSCLPDGIEESLDADAEQMMRYRPELFDFYDFGTTPRRSPDEIAERRAEIEALLPEETRALLARRRAERQQEISGPAKHKPPQEKR